MKTLNGTPPTVSVVMPIFNVEAYVDEAISSILNQSWRDLELILVDDGSTDQTASIAEHYRQTDGRVCVIRQSNRGLSDARNRGIDVARGKYLYFFDGDDVLVPDALASCMQHMTDKSLDLLAFSGTAFGDAVNIEEIDRRYRRQDRLIPVPGWQLLEPLPGQPDFSSSVCLILFLTELVRSPKLEFERGAIHEDEGFSPLLVCRAQRASSISKVYFRRRLRSGSITRSPPTSRNVDGLIRAARKIHRAADDYDAGVRQKRKILRRIERQRLRDAFWMANKYEFLDEFRNSLRREFNSTMLRLADPLLWLAYREGVLSISVRWLMCHVIQWRQRRMTYSPTMRIDRPTGGL